MAKSNVLRLPEPDIEDDGMEKLMEGIGKLLSKSRYYGVMDVAIRIRGNNYELEYEEMEEEITERGPGDEDDENDDEDDEEEDDDDAG